jgi:hypothetical protein
VALRRADLPSEESYRLFKKEYENEEEARAQQRAIDEWLQDILEVYFHVLFTSALHADGWLASRPGCFSTGEDAPG